MRSSCRQEEEEMENEEIGEQEIDEDLDEEFDEGIKILLMETQTLIQVLHQSEGDEGHMERPLTRRRITTVGYDYIHQALNEDPAIFRQDTRYICVEEMLAAFLQVVGQNSRYCVIRKTFGRSQFATSENFHKVLRALNTIASELMAKPGSGVPSKIRESTRFYPYFKDCIRAIDETHIPTIVRVRDVNNYRNRHGNISQNVLAACNFDLEFMYVLSGWEGSAHNSKVLSDALSRRNGLKVPQGHGCDPENENELFNLRHASLRNVIEMIFGIFKSRFTIFKSAPPFLFKTQAEIVLACAALHNFLRKECRSDEFPIEPTDESSSSSSSSIPVDEEDNFEQIYQTQDQQREDANTWRASIASAMWRDVI
ncbi:unnamed protein product [Prunus armeniaca]